MKLQKALLAIVVLVGIVLRVYGIDWDQGYHLHPDERFLTMVSTDIRIPSSLTEYFDPKISPLNPVNKNHAFFVYGMAPITINRAIGELLLNTTYDTIHLQGRALSAIADTLVIVIVFSIAQVLANSYKLDRRFPLIAAALYAIAVLPIQLSHFFAVDTFMNIFGWISIYFAVRYYVSKEVQRKWDVYRASIFLGLAFASKISALYFVPPVITIVCAAVLLHKIHVNKILYTTLLLLGSSLFFYCALRLGSPYYFQTGNIFDPRPSSLFIQNIQTLKSFENVTGYFPPAVQWIHAPLYLPALNLFAFGIGIPFGMLVLLGLGVHARLRNRFIIHALGLWALAVLIYQSFQFAKTMRYLIFIYPILALYASYGVISGLKLMSELPQKVHPIVKISALVLLLIWPAAFMSIYTKDHSRVAASKWMVRNIPKNSTLAWEYWDDPLPLQVPGFTEAAFRSQQIGIFDPDTAEKWNGIQQQLHNSDYYVMSSNRGWGSIPTTPERYPLATDFYQGMFAGKKGFTLVKEFTSYPSLRYLGIPIDFPDQWSEEAFTVYDHPKVMVFQKSELLKKNK